jgi:hypothetical protein
MYPIGKFEAPDIIKKEHCDAWMQTIDECPTLVFELTDHLTLAQLEWRYRPNGWSIAQVVHHMTDSHMNAFIRFKLALTEEVPTIKPYHEGAWAEMVDYKSTDIHYSKSILEGLHARWYKVLKSMDIHDFHNRSYYHPESQKNYILGEVLGLYDWHCRHHIAHIKQALASEGNF